MAEQECYGWIFVDKIPLLYDKKNVEKQQKIETWLDLYQLTTELNISKQSLKSVNQPIGYII
jgi:hypothetical protein